MGSRRAGGVAPYNFGSFMGSWRAGGIASYNFYLRNAKLDINLIYSYTHNRVGFYTKIIISITILAHKKESVLIQA